MSSREKGVGRDFRFDGVFALNQYISKTVNRSDIRLSPACSSFKSEQNKVLLQFIDGIFVTLSTLEGNSVTLMDKIARGQTESMALIDFG